jgi:chromosomal replication initiation ATPase DnaA
MTENADNELVFVSKLQSAVAIAAGLRNAQELVKRGKGSRELYVCKYRDAAIYLARTNTGLSTIRLGQLFGGRDHSTVVLACNREKLRLTRNPPRSDGLTHAQFHQKLLDLGKGQQDA